MAHAGATPLIPGAMPDRTGNPLNLENHFGRAKAAMAAIRTRRAIDKKSRSTQALHRDLEHLERIWIDVQGTRQRDAVYRYLRGVYQLVRRWKIRGQPRLLVRRTLEFAGDDHNEIQSEAFATVIRCTAQVDAKTRSKFSRVLRYVDRFNRRNLPFKQFIVDHGGLNGCASRFAARLGRGSRQKSRVS